MAGTIAREYFPGAIVMVKQDLAGLDRLLVVQVPQNALAER